MNTDVEITHSPGEGTLLRGDPRPHHDVPKTAGFRWSRNLGAWFVPRSRDAAPDLDRIESVAAQLRDRGLTVEVDGTRRSVAEVEAARAERAEVRSEHLSARAERLAAASSEQYERSRAIADMIPFGQPILVGHHSERRHRRDLDRIQSAMQRSVEVGREARDTQRRADAATGTQRHRESGPATLRRIERLEAEGRDIARNLARSSTVAHPGYRDRLTERATEIADEVAYWQRHLDELRAAGWHEWGPADFTVGDRVNGCATVERVNGKSLSVRHDVFPQFTSTLPYHKVRHKG